MLEELKAKTAVYAAIMLAFAAITGLLTGVEPLHNQFFALGAWVYALLLDNLLYRLSGSSQLVTDTENFLILAFWSVAFCSLLELLNLRLDAWYYLYEPATLSVRWTGRAFGWAALLPALFTTAELLRHAGLFSGIKAEPLEVSRRLIKGFYLSGAAMLLLALALPGFFRPLACAALIPLAEALNFRIGLPSLLRDWAAGMPGRTLRLACSGVISGLAWSCLNMASGSRWELPPAAGPALFGLSFPVYIVCAFLAVQAYSLSSLASWLNGGRTWEDPFWSLPGGLPDTRLRYAGSLFLFLLSWLAFRAVDAHTVKFYLGWI
jgi:hypothetical protein